MKSTWSILNEVINNKKSNVMLMTRKYPIQLRSRTKMPPCLTSHLSSFWSFCEFVVPTTNYWAGNFIEICTSFRTGTAAGYDQITTNVIKEIIDLIVQPLTYITNLSLSSGTVTNQMKIARLFLYEVISLFLPIIDQFPFCRLFLRF